MIDALIPTKLSVPLVRTDLVPRLRLLARLHEGVEKKFTLVSGPAGAGKTTLVAAWLSQLERVAAWLTLDSDDNEPGRFLNYLAAAVQGAGFDWRPTTDGVAAFPELISMLEAGSPLVLVLDDYHFIDNPTVHGYLTFLVDYGPNGFHLLLTSRADPPLALSRLRARGELAEIRAGDLLFSEREADTFLNEAQALNLPAPALRALYERTEGWAAGLQLAAISLRQLGPLDRPRFVTRFAGDDRFILDYLLEEIWQ